MAVTSDTLYTKLITRLVVDGTTQKTRTYSNVKEAATIAAIHATGTAINAIQALTCDEIYKDQRSLLTEEE